MLEFVAMVVLASGTVVCGAVRALEFETASAQNKQIQEAIQSISWKTALLIPIISSISLVLLFYFVDNIFKVLFVLVCLYAVYAVYFALKPITEKIFSWLKVLPNFKVNIMDISLKADDCAGLLIGAAVALGYATTGHWALNNAIGFVFVVFYMSFLRIPNIKVATLLLCGLFIYDIFWVFYSKPIFGKNVMVTVAQRVELPVKYLIPKVASDGRVSFSMLGLGDMVIPGLLITYTLRFDAYKIRLTPFSAKSGSTREFFSSYFGITVAGYTAGMIICCLVLVFFRVAQPALLYLVPCTLIPLVIAGKMRGDLGKLWSSSLPSVLGDTEEAKRNDTLGNQEETQHVTVTVE